MHEAHRAKTAVNFSLTRRALAQRVFGKEKAENLAGLVHMQSCVKEALQLSAFDGVHAMHDATEGGLVAALNEVAEASKLGFKIELEKVPSSPEARKLQDFFRLTDDQVLAMSSTGMILAAVSPETNHLVEATLRGNGFTPSFIGEFTKNRNRIRAKNGEDTQFPSVADDPYARILSGKV